MRRPVAAFFALVALGAIFASAACGSATGTDDGVGGEGNGAESSSGATSSSGSSRPAFDASLPPGETGDANVDPTPEGGGDTCVDNDDPGNTEVNAKKLADTDDCDNSFKTVKGVLNGPVDIDFYKLTGNDKGGIPPCQKDTEFSSPSAGTELCVWARCKNATANAVTGCANGVEDTSVAGMKGCCAAAPGKATPEWDCEGFTDNDSADFIIRIKHTTGANACLPYSFSYRF
jgi:hypothetical protein